MKLGKTYDKNIILTRENTFDNEVIIIDGQGRSGKNLISVLLTCMNRVEKMRLDSQIDYIPRYYFLGKMSLDAAVTALRTEFDEKYYYNSISRDVNFRIDDYSGVLKQAKRFEYFKRLFLPADDAAVARLKKQKPIFQEMTHDGLHVATLFFAALKNRLKMIHVFRDPVGNIYEQNVRNFGTRIGNDPREFQLAYQFNNYPVTLNAIGKEEDYLSGNSIERLVLTVDSMFRLNLQGYFDLTEKERQKIYFIEFEDFVENPFSYMKGLENFIGEPFGKAKKRILKRERCPRKLDYSERDRRIEKIRSNLRDNYDEIFMKLIQDYDSKPWLDWN
tara:strand:- start:13081 stop:14076 length:996 start_codon:yes stop_codon:yes gene_type:complete